jgi:16S rRNA (uracil1498-N3)-methyltransferase
MIRIYVEKPLREGVDLELPEGAAHHLRRVLRVRQHDEVVVFNGQGGEYHGRISHAGQHALRVCIERFDPTERESPVVITLVQAVSRGDRMDYTIQKAVELGVSRIVPLATQRGVVRLDAARMERRRDHWRGIIKHACEQCGRTRLPLLDELHAVDQWAQADAASERYVLDPHATRGLTEEKTPGGAVSLVAGAEGGFDDAEIELLRDAGYRAVRLGPRILRTETAAVAALVILQSLWGDLS